MYGVLTSTRQTFTRQTWGENIIWYHSGHWKSRFCWGIRVDTENRDQSLIFQPQMIQPATYPENSWELRPNWIPNSPFVTGKAAYDKALQGVNRGRGPITTERFFGRGRIHEKSGEIFFRKWKWLESWFITYTISTLYIHDFDILDNCWDWNPIGLGLKFE